MLLEQQRTFIVGGVAKTLGGMCVCVCVCVGIWLVMVPDFGMNICVSCDVLKMFGHGT